MFAAREGLYDKPVDLPCGQCVGCRLERSRQWAMRCVHEASLYDRNCFVTLTYSPEHLPADGGLDYNAPVLWMKRVRDRFGPNIRSFGCAEYGEKLGRPHFHIILFNFDFDDKVLFKTSGGNRIYTSADLASTWGLGHSVVAGFSFESAAYVARYCTKKITGRMVDQVVRDSEGRDTGLRTKVHSADVSAHYGGRPPERSVCVSRRPGIGKGWYDKFGSHSRSHDFVVIRGKKMKPPQYYDRLFERAFPKLYARKKVQRKSLAVSLSSADSALWSYGERDRLSVKEICHELKFKQLKRGYENGS